MADVGSVNLRALGNGLRQVLEEQHGEPMGFCLVVFPLVGDGPCAWIGHGEQPHMVEVMRNVAEQLDKPALLPVGAGAAH